MSGVEAPAASPEYPAGSAASAGKGRTALVVAHPDDEALWLSSAIAAADRVVFCFGDLFERPKDSLARRATLAALPLDGVVALQLPESGVKYAVDWSNPRLTATGIAISDAAVRARYETNYADLVAALREALAGTVTVYTHNPWGEYGHAEHIQVHRAVAALQGELGYTVWFSNYIGYHSWRLGHGLSPRTFWHERRDLAPDRRAARGLMRIYKRHGAWTWNATHRWPGHETLYAIHPGDASRPRYAMEGEWVLDVRGLRWWPPPLRAVRWRMSPAAAGRVGLNI